MPDHSPNDPLAADSLIRPGRPATVRDSVVNELFPKRDTPAQKTSTEASSRRSRFSGGGGISRAAHNPLCPSVLPVVNEFPKREEAPAPNDLTTLRANLKSLIISNLLASPFLTRFYVDSVISDFPNSNAAKILAANYQKIMNRISMPNPKSCTHIKVTGVRCESPALRGEQFCYFHQHAHRGVRRPPRSRLHPMALIESGESIQSSLIEVINGLLRNTLDAKRAELILRALHIAVKNARNVRFDTEVYPKVREVPQYAEPESGDVETTDHVGNAYVGMTDHVGTGVIARPASKASMAVTTAADPFDDFLPAVAAVPYKPVDPRDPHFLERSEEGGRALAREAAERRSAEARSAQAAVVVKGKVPVAADALVRPGREATVTRASIVTNAGVKAPSNAAPTQRLSQPSPSNSGNLTVAPPKRKPPMGVKTNAGTTAAPKERKNAAQRASAG